MKMMRWLGAALVAVTLSGCMAPLVAPFVADAQSKLLWALIKPMVGLDPNEVNLFEQPLIKDRLQPLLGDHYGTAVSLLKTADEVQQEGPMFYVLSNNALTKPLADKAGFVWNAQTNQMAVLLQQQGQPQQVFSEALGASGAATSAAAATSGAVPTWPTAMQGLIQTPAQALTQQATAAATSAVNTSVQQATSAATSTATSAVNASVQQAASAAAGTAQ